MSLEAAGGSHTSDDLMNELHQFLLKRIDKFSKAKPKTEIEAQQRSRRPSKTTLANKNKLNETKLGILIRLFEKYLQFRMSPVDFAKESDLDALKYIVEAMASTSCRKIADFKIEDLWQLMKTARVVLTNPKAIVANELSKYGKEVTVELFTSGVCKQISYFGEFLYYCSTLSRHESSPVAKIKQSSTEKEDNVIDELARVIRPELGISTFLVYRNWISDCDRATSKDMQEKVDEIEKYPGFDAFHDSYCKSLLKISQFPMLRVYFGKFISFLGSEASSAHWYFGIDLVTNREYISALNEKKHYQNLLGRDRFLLKVLRFFVDVLIFLHDLNENAICFYELPKYLRIAWNRANCFSDYVPTSLFELTQVLDFIFVENFQNNLTDAFHEMCVEISSIIIERFSMHHCAESPVKKFCLLPFFDVNL